MSHTPHATPPPTPSGGVKKSHGRGTAHTGQSHPLVKQWFWVITIVLALTLGIGSCTYGCWKGEEAEAEKQAKIAAAAPVRTVVVTEKVGKVPTFYRYADWSEGCIRIPIEEWEFEAIYKGEGKVMVYPPNGAKPFEDGPGIDNNTHIKPGLWTWCKKEHGPDDGVKLYR